MVEQAISCLKAAIKPYLSCPDQQCSMGNRDEARREGLPLIELRKRLLLRATIVTRNINAITAQTCMHNHIQTYVPRCLEKGKKFRNKINTLLSSLYILCTNESAKKVIEFVSRLCKDANESLKN